MRFIFASTTCSEKTYKEVFASRTRQMIDPMQKFLLQIMRGLAADPDNTVESISVKPVSHSCYRGKKVDYSIDNEKDIFFKYVAFKNGIVSRFISTYLSVYNKTRELLKEHDQTVIITDPLNPYISMAARRAAKKKGVKTIAIITDLPLFASKMKQRKENLFKRMLKTAFENISNNEARKYDAYIFLTDSMNEVVNTRKKPFIIIEGTAVSPEVNFRLSPQNTERVFVYAGGVYEKYGVKRLVDAFCSAQLENTVLNIYGDGTYVDELKDVCKNTPSVHYCGCVLNTELMAIESAADLLINPRFSDEEYTKYSFPSKTLEYLSSGTAVLSTKLKGIPKEYEPYLFWFDDESLNGMIQKLREINAMSDNALRTKGSIGQKFVLDNKNNIVQAKKIAELSRKIM